MWVLLSVCRRASRAFGALPTQTLYALRLCAVTSKPRTAVPLSRTGHLLIAGIPANRWSAERFRHFLFSKECVAFPAHSLNAPLTHLLLSEEGLP